MADKTKIEWTEATWNPITGCSVVSPGCTNCYAMKLAGTRLKHHPSRAGLTRDSKAGPVWTGEVRLNDQWLDQPLRWTRPRMIFVCAHGDLFHEDVPDEWIDKVFAVMALAPQHTFQVLTKRAERMRAWFEERWQGTPAQRFEFSDGTHIDVPAGGPSGRRHQVEQACEALLDQFGLANPDKDDLWTADGSCKAMQWAWPLPNVWLGVSAEDHARAEERIPHLLDTPAAVRWVSAEPLLGPLDLTGLRRYNPTRAPWIDALRGSVSRGGLPTSPSECGISTSTSIGELPRLDWIVAGGESGRDARPMHPDWARSLRDQCAAAGVPFFFKQWGAWLPGQNEPLPSGSQSVAHWQDGGWGARETTNPARNYVMWDPHGNLHVGGSRHHDNYFEVAAWAARVGKKAAGALLDGVEHKAWPELPR